MSSKSDSENRALACSKISLEDHPKWLESTEAHMDLHSLFENKGANASKKYVLALETLLSETNIIACVI
jgi:hypothetical protein